MESAWFVPFAGAVDDAGGSWWGCGASRSLSRVGMDSELDNLPSISFACSSPLRYVGGGSPSGRGHDKGSWDDLLEGDWCVRGGCSFESLQYDATWSNTTCGEDKISSVTILY